MARIISYNDLSAKVYDEFSWRRKELQVLKSKIPINKNSLQSAMLRSALPLLYAHWEGFVKAVMSNYLEFVSNKYLLNKDLEVQFIALSLQSKLGDLTNSNIENRVKVINFILNDIDKQSNIPRKGIINTKSNLRFNVLQEILFILDLNDAHIDSKEDLINDLVDTRNYIAHGEHKLIDYKTFEIIFDDMIALMEYLKTRIENNAILESYKSKRLRIPYI